MAKKMEIGTNIEAKIDGDKLVLEIDLSADTNPSVSGKTLIIASSQGNKRVNDDVFVGLNVYKYADKKKGKK
jgi:hypothetical protein